MENDHGKRDNPALCDDWPNTLLDLAAYNVHNDQRNMPDCIEQLAFVGGDGCPHARLLEC
jgi:hypothetical protein